MKDIISANQMFTTFLPLLFLYWTEYKINRLYRFGKVHFMLTSCLTAMVFGYNFIKVY